MRMTETEMRESLRTIMSEAKNSHKNREVLRKFINRFTDDTLEILVRDKMSVKDFEQGLKSIRDEEERESLAERFVVVSKDGLRGTLELMVREAMGLSHDYDDIRKIVEGIPEEERPEYPDLIDLSPKERGFVRRATRSECTTDCPRMRQGDCPFETLNDCPRYRIPVGND